MIEIKNNFTVDELALINCKSKNKYRVLSIICLIIGVIGIIPSLIMIFNDDNFIWTFLLGLSVFLIIFFGYLLFTIRPSGFKNRLFKVNPTLKGGIEYKYLFDIDELTVIQKTNTSESANKIKFSGLNKVVINDDYIYLYLNKLQAFPIKKKEINTNDLEEIKKLLANKIK